MLLLLTDEEINRVVDATLLNNQLLTLGVLGLPKEILIFTPKQNSGEKDSKAGRDLKIRTANMSCAI